MAFICKLKAENQIKREEWGEKEVNDMVKRQQNDELMFNINRIIIHLS